MIQFHLPANSPYLSELLVVVIKIGKNTEQRIIIQMYTLQYPPNNQPYYNNYAETGFLWLPKNGIHVGRTRGKPMKVMHDGGKEFTSTKFKYFLNLNGIKDKQIPKGYPQEQGKVEAYNKIVISEFLQVEELKDEKDGAEKYESFVNS